MASIKVGNSGLDVAILDRDEQLLCRWLDAYSTLVLVPYLPGQAGLPTCCESASTHPGGLAPAEADY